MANINGTEVKLLSYLNVSNANIFLFWKFRSITGG